ncbi:hypothetical protein OAM67_00240 [bacterium]|nr:hypothetical protein [bacterium]
MDTSDSDSDMLMGLDSDASDYSCYTDEEGTTKTICFKRKRGDDANSATFVPVKSNEVVSLDSNKLDGTKSKAKAEADAAKRVKEQIAQETFLKKARQQARRDARTKKPKKRSSPQSRGGLLSLFGLFPFLRSPAPAPAPAPSKPKAKAKPKRVALKPPPDTNNGMLVIKLVHAITRKVLKKQIILDGNATVARIRTQVTNAVVTDTSSKHNIRMFANDTKHPMTNGRCKLRNVIKNGGTILVITEAVHNTTCYWCKHDTTTNTKRVTGWGNGISGTIYQHRFTGHRLCGHHFDALGEPFKTGYDAFEEVPQPFGVRCLRCRRPICGSMYAYGHEQHLCKHHHDMVQTELGNLPFVKFDTKHQYDTARYRLSTFFRQNKTEITTDGITSKWIPTGYYAHKKKQRNRSKQVDEVMAHNFQ